jgi:hypothetical protein
MSARIRAKLDRAYDDRLSGRVPDDLWTTKSAELEEELRRVRTEMNWYSPRLKRRAWAPGVVNPP